MSNSLGLNVDTSTNPLVSVKANRTVISENGGVGAFIIQLSQPAPDTGLNLNISALDSDNAGGDVSIGTKNLTLQIDPLTKKPASVTIAPGATEARLILTGIPDSVLEGDEVSTLTLLSGTGYTVAPSYSTDAITLTETLMVSVTANPTVISENGGVGTFTIQLSQPAPETGLNLNISALDSDNAGGDVSIKTENLTLQIDPLTNRPASVTIAPGATEARLILTGIPDPLLEGGEVSTLTLLSGTGYAVLPSQSTDAITITDNIISGFIQTENPSFENPTRPTATASPNGFFTSTPAEVPIIPNQALLSRPEVMLSSRQGNDLLYSKALSPMMFRGDGNNTIYFNNVSEVLV